MIWFLTAVVVFQFFAMVGMVIRLEHTRTMMLVFGRILGEMIDILKLSEQRYIRESVEKNIDQEFRKIIKDGWES